ncbi:MAG: enoyl-CoA hydratase-related protein [Bacteroidota bacterium]|nr:enoyl-CoA hydratase-related protein [Bacteroidota bacterium]
MTDTLVVSSVNAVLLLTLNRPERHNSLDAALVSEIHKALEETRDDAGIRVVVLQGEGESFCAGHDPEYLISISPNPPMDHAGESLAFLRMLYELRAFPKPTIARVQGAAISGGCCLALACDIVVAAEEARFGFPDVRFGFVPGAAVPLLVERVGAASARELLLRGNVVDADTAMDLGMINYVVGAGELDASVEKLAFEIAEKTSPEAVRLTKRLYFDVLSMDFAGAMRHTAAFEALARTTESHHAGLDAIREQRKPSWE